MKILMISPYTGGIDVYVKALTSELNKLQNVKAEISGGNENENAYDVENKRWKSSEEVKKIVEGIKNRINTKSYDIVAFHYGKNDIEQYLPVILEKTKPTLFIYFVHYLSWNLFSQYLGDGETAKLVEDATIGKFNNYIFFGEYSRQFLNKKYNKQLSGQVVFLPETHFNETLNSDDISQMESEFQGSFLGKYKKVVYFAGFGSNYKDIDSVLKSFEAVQEEFLFVIAGKGWAKRVGFEEKKINKVQVKVIERYLTSKEYKFLSSQSLFGIFPYRQPLVEGEYFQGSGTLPNYIREGKATIVYYEGSLPEYVGKSGIVVKAGDTAGLSDAINVLLSENKRSKYENEAMKIAELFSIKHHANSVYDYFKEITSLEQAE